MTDVSPGEPTEQLSDAVPSWQRNVFVTVPRLVTGALILIAIGINFANVISRYLFNFALYWAEEIMIFLVVWCVFVAAATVAFNGANLKMDLLSAKFPPGLRKAVNAMTTATMIGLVGFAAWQSMIVVRLFADGGSVSVTASVPMVIPHSALFVGLVLMVLADLAYSSPNAILNALKSPEIQFSIKLSLVSCTIAAFMSLWAAVPIGYLMSRFDFRFKNLIDTVLDIPIVLPPLVVGLCLLILFNYRPFAWLSDQIVFEWPAVILAQFVVACAFAVRTMRLTFDQIPQRYEQVAMTLGCNRSQAFWMVIMPQAKGGVLAAATLAWARSLGEFGPILVFAGATRFRTEVLPTSFFLEMQAGNLAGMCAVSLIMIAAAGLVLMLARLLGMKRVGS